MTLIKQLQYIEINYEFSKNCPKEVKNEIIKKGLVKKYDGTLMLTSLGEKEIGLDLDNYNDYDEEHILEESDYDEKL